MCRPTKYEPTITPQLAKWMRRGGLTDEQIAEELGVAKSTFNLWREKHPEFSEALKGSRRFADSLVEDSLLKRALGYAVKEVHIESERTVILAADGEGGIVERPAIVRKVKRIKKHVAPDVTAQIFWLKNRQPDKWREKQADEPADHGEILERLVGSMMDAAKANVQPETEHGPPAGDTSVQPADRGDPQR